jgi:hypothetical protein
MPQFYEADGKPFEANGIVYSPKYSSGEVIRYEAQLKNLRLLVYPTKRYLVNSIHKYWHNGCNHTNFTLTDAYNAIEDVNDKTEVNWFEAKVKSLEVGCNITTDANKAINSLLSYKGKDFLPMITGSKKYGAKCIFDVYSVKLYDKELQVKEMDGINIGKPLLRWELVMGAKYFNRYNLYEALTLENLFNPQVHNLIVNDAIGIYNKSLKNQIMDYSKLSLAEKKILACMKDKELREAIKAQHRETYKKDRAAYNKLMRDRSNCFNDNTGELIEEKFKELIGEIKAEKNIL